MTPHAPKLCALEALVADRLSQRGRARIERHLAACDTCRAALSAVREYAKLRESARDLVMPELPWERMERALDTDAAQREQTARSGKLLALALPLLAIAATVVIGWVGISGQRQAQEQAQEQAQQVATGTQLPTPPAVQAVDPVIAGWVTLGAPATHAPGMEVIEGATLRTGAGEELHVRLTDETGIVLAPESALIVSQLRKHSVRLTLLHGGVSSMVRKLTAADSYVVEAGDIAAEVRGTRFFVARTEDDVRIYVHEGRVAVLRQGKEVSLLTAGQSFPEQAAIEEGKPAADRQVLGLDLASLDWPTLTLPPLPQVTAWLVNGVRWAAPAEMAMRAPPGDQSLSFEDARGHLHALKVRLAAEGTRIEEADVRAALRAEADSRMGTLAPELIRPVIQRGLPGLRRCYEQGLRRAQVEARLTLAVRVAPDGHVARAELLGESALPAGLTSCIANQARGWVFPAPDGGPVAFEVPLNLKASSAP